MAPQSTATNGPSRRGDSSCTARASTPFEQHSDLGGGRALEHPEDVTHRRRDAERLAEVIARRHDDVAESRVELNADDGLAERDDRIHREKDLANARAADVRAVATRVVAEHEAVAGQDEGEVLARHGRIVEDEIRRLSSPDEEAGGLDARSEAGVGTGAHLESGRSDTHRGLGLAWNCLGMRVVFAHR